MYVCMWYDFTFQCIPAIIQMENDLVICVYPFSGIKKWLNSVLTIHFKMVSAFTVTV